MPKINDLIVDQSFELGISGFFHDSSIALFKNGVLIDFIKEEDLLRIKGANGFPYRALGYLKAKYHLDNANISSVSFYEKPLKSWLFILQYLLKKDKASKSLLKKHLHNFWEGSLSFSRKFRSIIKIDRDKFFFADHHASHVMSAIPFFQNFSMEKPYLNLTFDAYGDGLSSTISIFKDGDLKVFSSNIFPNSLGLFYSAFTQFCGFQANEGEFKLMALASYGEPKYFDFILENIISVDGPIFKLNMDWFIFDVDDNRYFSDKFLEKFGNSADSSFYDLHHKSVTFEHYANIAASAQAVLEHVVCSSVNWAIQKTGIGDISLSGGVAQNCRAIARLANLDGINSIIVPPSPGDSGAAIGAVNFFRLRNSQIIRPIQNLSFGEINVCQNPPENFFIIIEKEDSVRLAAQLIDEGKIIALFDGRHEIGPRALGFRSIICNAKNLNAISDLNSKIKKREEFRPLAPAMLSDYVEDFFYLHPSIVRNFDWMGSICFANRQFDQEYRGALHVDKSARLQIIKDESSLLYKVARKTETKMLINTSFNIASDPIVFDYIDVFINMRRMGLQYLLTHSGLFCVNSERK